MHINYTLATSRITKFKVQAQMREGRVVSFRHSGQCNRWRPFPLAPALLDARPTVTIVVLVHAGKQLVLLVVAHGARDFQWRTLAAGI